LKELGTTARDLLIAKYLEYFNDYLTVGIFSEHNGLTPEQGAQFLDLAKQVYSSKHPEA
jgi:hypothetical protein